MGCVVDDNEGVFSIYHAPNEPTATCGTYGKDASCLPVLPSWVICSGSWDRSQPQLIDETEEWPRYRYEVALKNDRTSSIHRIRGRGSEYVFT